jgi:DNA-binding transcriptional regulator/RsmH inhibitor MraZ
MLSFCGLDRCSVDSNGRIKLSPRVMEDFSSRGGDVVMHCLPEGAVAVYPEDVYLAMRRTEPNPAARAAESFVFRRTLRSFGAWSQSERISAQGRITLPPAFREHAGIAAGAEAVVVGVEIGIEIWSPERFAEEQRKLQEHMLEKGEREMATDLLSGAGQAQAQGPR